MFTKMLKNIGNLELEEAADRIADIGFDGADLVVRPDGYVLPEKASKELPGAIQILESRDLAVPMITTDITNADDGFAQEIFSSASKSGVEFIKLGYWKYEGFGKIKSQIEKAHEQLKGIERLSREYGVTAAIHTHSGPFLSANPAVVLMLLQSHDPKYICAYIDPGHLLAQTGPTGWEMGIDILREYVRLVAIKNFWYFRVVDEKTGEGKWERRMLPLREELVPWPQVFKYLKAIGFDGNVSLHSEYEGFTLEELIHQTREDLRYLKDVLKGTS